MIQRPDGLRRAVSERQIAVRNVSAKYELIGNFPLANVIARYAAPNAALVTDFFSGNKLNHCIEAEIEHVVDCCDGDDYARMSTVTMRMQDKVQASVRLSSDGVSNVALVSGAPIGIYRCSVLVSIRQSGTTNVGLVSVLANGKRAPVNVGGKCGHPSRKIQIAILPKKSGELRFGRSDPTSLRVPPRPLRPLGDLVSPIISVPTRAK